MEEMKRNKKLQEDLTIFLDTYNFNGINRTDINNVIDLIRLKNIKLKKTKIECNCLGMSDKVKCGFECYS